MNKALGKRIRCLREDRKMTQEQMAGLLDMSRQKYARIENGVNNITLEVLAKIASIFQIDVSDITKVLEKEPSTVYRAGESTSTSINTVYEMLDLFYANKNIYERMHYREDE